MRQLCLFMLFACLCHGVSRASECTARGRFPNNNSGDCKGYTMCLLGAANSFMQYSLTCPVGIYSHLEQQCTNATTYQCLPNFECNMTGNFENLSSKNCSSYVVCVEGINGIVTARQVECPLDQIFSPQEAVCVNSTEYKCNAGIESNVTNLLLEVQPNTTYFNIQVSGENRFNLSGNVSVNHATNFHSKSALLFVFMMLLDLNY